MRCLCCGLGILLALGCSGSSPSTASKALTEPSLNHEAAVQTLQEQAQELGHAIVAENHAKMVDETHPRIVALAGGREQMLHLLEMNAKGMKARGSAIQTVSFEEPASVAEGAKNWFGIVPFTLQMIMGQFHGSKKSFLIGVSNDGGKRWKFVDGGVVDASKIKKLFPAFPDQLQLPKKHSFVVDSKEQPAEQAESR